MSEEEIRLDQTKKVFEAIADIIVNGSCTYRYLIYDMLGFEAEYYADLISGLTITNAIVDLEDFQQENKQLKEELELKSGMNIAVQNLKLIDENKQLKEVIEEVREYIEKECSDLLIGYFHNRFDTTEYYEKLLQILDKVKEVK